jgi:hypothetical protein
MFKVDGLGKRVRSLRSKAGPRITPRVARVYYPIKQGNYIINISKVCDRLYISHFNKTRKLCFAID